MWSHLERPHPDVPPIELTVHALAEAAQSFAAGDHEHSMSEEQVQAARARYMAHAHELARELEARWTREPPRWNHPTGDPEVDALVWFDYVHTDDLPAAPG